MAASIPECPGCGRPAPPPDSPEGGAWHIGVREAFSTLVVCPDCFASPERRRGAEEEVARSNLAFAEDPSNTILFVGGRAKPINLCSPEELEAGREDMQRRVEQARAWMDWLRALSERMEDER